MSLYHLWDQLSQDIGLQLHKQKTREIIDCTETRCLPAILRQTGASPLHVESLLHSLVDSPTNSNPSSQE